MNGTNRYQGQNVGAALRQQGRKARWLANEVGVSESMISKISKGDRGVNEELAGRIAKALNIPLFLLFELPERSDSQSLADVA